MTRLALFLMINFVFGVYSSSLNRFENVEVPIIDVFSLTIEDPSHEEILQAKKSIESIGDACKTSGFFYIKNHNVPESLISNLTETASLFFSMEQDFKDSISMIYGGKAWRGYFQNGAEVTSGIPDQKEGIYFGTDLPDDHDPRPLHGKNIWPEGKVGQDMKSFVTQYMSHMKSLGALLMGAIASSLGLENHHFGNQFANPTELFRIFNYPPHNSSQFPEISMGVGEHTDYGYITILWQDGSGGLQAKSVDGQQWIDVRYIPGTFVVNLGDALEHNTGGLLRATPHRVLQRANAVTNRLSLPYFFDPNFDAVMQSVAPLLRKNEHAEEGQEVEELETVSRSTQRWDHADPSLFEGTYGEYLLKKVSKAFPQLAKSQCILENNDSPQVD